MNLISAAFNSLSSTGDHTIIPCYVHCDLKSQGYETFLAFGVPNWSISCSIVLYIYKKKLEKHLSYPFNCKISAQADISIGYKGWAAVLELEKSLVRKVLDL